MLFDGMAGSGIQSAAREAEYAAKVRLMSECITRQMTEEEKERYPMNTNTVSQKRGPKPRAVRYCPGCNAEMKLRQEQLKEPTVTCYKCNSMMNPVQLLDEPKELATDPVPEEKKEIDAGWQEAAEAPHKEAHEAWLKDQSIIHFEAEGEYTAGEAKPDQNVDAKDRLVVLLTEITGLIGHLYDQGRKDGAKEGYTKAVEDITSAIRTIGCETVMMGGN